MEHTQKAGRIPILHILAGIMFAFLVIFIAVSAYIGRQVRDECLDAQAKYGGDCTDALMARVSDPSSQDGKNGAIWALGQLGDERSLPLLKSLDSGGPVPAEESWETGISRYELRKAIDLIESGDNLSAFIWR